MKLTLREWRRLKEVTQEGRGGLAGTGGRRQSYSNAEAVCGVGGAPDSEKEETDSSLNL